MTGVVVDTSVLHKADDVSAAENWDAVSLLTKLPGSLSVFVDAQWEIWAEYRSVFSPGIQSLSFQWWQRQSAIVGGVQTIAGKLTKGEMKTFRDQGCDDDDRPFIGVALRAKVPVIHEDGDYEEPCAQSLGIVSHRLAAAAPALGL